MCVNTVNFSYTKWCKHYLIKSVLLGHALCCTYVSPIRYAPSFMNNILYKLHYLLFQTIVDVCLFSCNVLKCLHFCFPVGRFPNSFDHYSEIAIVSTVSRLYVYSFWIDERGISFCSYDFRNMYIISIQPFWWKRRSI